MCAAKVFRSRTLVLAIAAGCGLSGPWLGGAVADPGSSVQLAAIPPRSQDGLLIVDCQLPGQVRRLGAGMTYLAQRRPMKLSADECAIRGGEYVAYDRADLPTALAVWLPQASSGDAQAQTYVGELYERGIGGTAPNYREAADWYAKAAKQGNARAQINLGFLYEKGLGVPKDQVTALNLYRQASGVAGIIALEGAAAARPSALQDEALQSLRKELEETRRQLDKAREELREKQGVERIELNRLERERKQAHAQGNVEAEQRFTSELRQREAELNAQRRAVADLERTIADYRARLEGAESERSALKRQLAEAQRQLAQSTSELDSRRAKAAADERERASLQQQLEQARRTASSSGAERERVATLEQQLKQREAELARQAAEIARVEKDAKRFQSRLTELEAKQAPEPAQVIDEKVAITAPSIQLIDPPVTTMRSPLTIKVRGSLSMREIVGKVVAPAGLLSFTVNERAEQVDPNGLFKTQLQLGMDATPVSLVAVDRRGKRTAVEFTFVPETSVAKETAKKPAAPALDYGRYHALVIGNQTYKHLPTLDTSVADATAVSEVLSKKYGFKVKTLTNATRYEILSALNELRGRLTENDNLLIYYAGHGELDRANLRGHWLPVDAEPNSDANWISSVAITDILNAMSVKHVLVVADSCYSGAMTRSSIGQLESGLSEDARTSWLKALVRARARTVLTSGGVQPVMDGGGGKHSIFAKAFLDVLDENEGALEAQRLYHEVAARVVYLAASFQVEQRPEYAPMKFAGHESGDFIFVPAGT